MTINRGRQRDRRLLAVSVWESHRKLRGETVQSTLCVNI